MGETRRICSLVFVAVLALFVLAQPSEARAAGFAPSGQVQGASLGEGRPCADAGNAARRDSNRHHCCQDPATDATALEGRPPSRDTHALADPRPVFAVPVQRDVAHAPVSWRFAAPPRVRNLSIELLNLRQ